MFILSSKAKLFSFILVVTVSLSASTHMHQNSFQPNWLQELSRGYKRSQSANINTILNPEELKRHMCRSVELPKESEPPETIRSLSQRLAKFISETEELPLCFIEPMKDVCNNIILRHNTFHPGHLAFRFNETAHTQAVGKACPWHWELRSRSNMYPRLRAVAVCNSKNCSLNEECLIKGGSATNPNAISYGCQQVYTLMPVLKREEKTNNRGQIISERWEFFLEEVPVSCSCQVGPPDVK